MSSLISQKRLDAFTEAVKNLVTEDDEPVDNIFSAQQQRLLVQSLYSGWMPPSGEDAPDEPRKFMADANVGIFVSPYQPAIVPDVFISLDVERPEGWELNEVRAYYVWEFEKAPDVAVEIVSNRKGGEMDKKRKRYARLGVKYYVVFDPFSVLEGETLYVYEPGLVGHYNLRSDYQLPDASLSLTLWNGVFENTETTWLRWVDAKGNLIPTAYELAAIAESRAAEALTRAQHAEDLAKQADDLAKQAEDWAKQAEDRAAKAENENAQLREELERLRAQLSGR
ncbi:MAG TPA: Uma2 family endonuclease [Blastocatellia bacterium]|nr:Uma2 family endonuclease [Blastocatellia bacterium]HMV86841.1 Uma2 family endonuclease [Blastocatellia bacterium]HMX25033.1 Uma2 family endonuclease [Blastocatellia bacterium]HMY76509.1 Uma2 family endonuclease [Blastocatellia bacterium]HMZ18743.1 Uma2 family endonuclease [Blastocatellia bacterium]